VAPVERDGIYQMNLRSCAETHTMSHIVDSCPSTKLDGGLSRLHSADDDVVQWLINLGRWTCIPRKGSTVKHGLHCGRTAQIKTPPVWIGCMRSLAVHGPVAKCCTLVILLHWKLCCRNQDEIWQSSVA